jgi:hypothetical protein
MAVPDFNDYVVKTGIKRPDGRIISPKAFEDDDGKKVLVMFDGSLDPGNCIGHAILAWKPDGMTAEIYLNDSVLGQAVKEQIRKRGGAAEFWVYAIQIERNDDEVIRGVIRTINYQARF